MHKEKHIKLFWVATLLAVALLSLQGCKVPGMHQPEIEQGNIVTQKMVDRLRPDMTKAQVEFVLGRPVYQNTFNVNRWDYIYTRESRTGERVRRILTLKFEDDVLVGISGDYRPEGDAVDILAPLLETIDDASSPKDTTAEDAEPEPDDSAASSIDNDETTD